MVRTSLLAVGDGGAVGWIYPETIEFPDPGQPTFCYIQLSYKVSGDGAINTMNFVTDTALTQAAIRSAEKDLIKQSILDIYGINLPKSVIKMANSLE